MVKVSDENKIHSTIWEDNAGCIILANMELPQMTPRSKHYSMKYHWFTDKLKPNSVTVEKIDGKLQIADIFMKSLCIKKFKKLCKLLSGW